MPRTHLGLKWVIFLARSPLIRPHLAGGAVRRLSRQTLTRLPLRDVDRISKIWLYFGKFWTFLGTFFDTFFTLTFLPYHLMLSSIFNVLFRILCPLPYLMSSSVFYVIFEFVALYLVLIFFNQSINQFLSFVALYLVLIFFQSINFSHLLLSI